MVVNPYDKVRKRPTIYDGIGHTTTPYSTIKAGKKGPYHINRRWLRFHSKFFTQNGGYDAYYTIGRYDTRTRTDTNKGSDQLTIPSLEHEFSNELIGFKTNNQGDNSQPTMNITLAGFRDWEQILSENDYCAITVEECYPDDQTWLQAVKNDPYAKGGIEQRTLMTGLISNIHANEDPNSQGRVYIVTCNGMEKILSNITLGMPPKAQVGGVNLLFDINGESNPANETFPFGSNTSTSKSSNITKGNAKVTGDEREKEFISWCNKEGLSAAQTAGLGGNAVVEAGVQSTDWSGGTNNWFGISRNGVGVHIPQSLSVTDYLNYVILHKGSQSFPSLSYCPSGFYKYRSDTKSLSAYKCADWWCDNIEKTQQPNADSVKGEHAEQIYNQIKG